MSKGLEALESIIETFCDKESEDIQIVRKELKALEIIINKYYLYDYGIYPHCLITEEEYKLLKEVLKVCK